MSPASPHTDQSPGGCVFGQHLVVSLDATGAEGELALDYTDRLRRLAINDPRVVGDDVGEAGVDPVLEPKALALVQLAALVAVGGAVPSYGAHADAALSAGATVAEIVDVLVAVVPVVGIARVVAAAPKLARALGYDIDAALVEDDALVDDQSGG